MLEYHHQREARAMRRPPAHRRPACAPERHSLRSRNDLPKAPRRSPRAPPTPVDLGLVLLRLVDRFDDPTLATTSRGGQTSPKRGTAATCVASSSDSVAERSECNPVAVTGVLDPTEPSTAHAAFHGYWTYDLNRVRSALWRQRSAGLAAPGHKRGAAWASCSTWSFNHAATARAAGRRAPRVVSPQRRHRKTATTRQVGEGRGARCRISLKSSPRSSDLPLRGSRRLALEVGLVAFVSTPVKTVSESFWRADSKPPTSAALGPLVNP